MEKNVLIRDVPDNDRPRERLIREGAAALSDRELLAIILGSGTKNESVLQLAGRLVRRFDTMEMLRDASVEELKEVKGIGLAKAAQILACFELGARMARLHQDTRYTIRAPEDGANYLMEEMRVLSQEHFVAPNFI